MSFEDGRFKPRYQQCRNLQLTHKAPPILSNCRFFFSKLTNEAWYFTIIVFSRNNIPYLFQKIVKMSQNVSSGKYFCG